MPDVDRILSEYIAEHRAGGAADPLAYLDRLEGGERAELALLIDGYLARAPRREFDADAFRASPAAPAVEALARSLEGRSGLWPSVLPALRARAQLKRSEVVARLAQALGASGREEKVARYYHQMEHGLLPADGVSDRVLAALAAIVGERAEALRHAGRGVGPGPDATAEAVFARTAPAPEYSAPDVAPVTPAEEWDEVDELFRGG